MGLLPEGEANLARLLGIVEKSQVSLVMVIPVVVCGVLVRLLLGGLVMLVILVMLVNGDVGVIGVGGVHEGLTQGRLLGLKEQWSEHR